MNYIIIILKSYGLSCKFNSFIYPSGYFIKSRIK
nr:MAG TPA: hypothetical protein [Bacteriophage sp.]